MSDGDLEALLAVLADGLGILTNEAHGRGERVLGDEAHALRRRLKDRLYDLRAVRAAQETP